jgi:hypothetical protein
VASGRVPVLLLVVLVVLVALVVLLLLLVHAHTQVLRKKTMLVAEGVVFDETKSKGKGGRITQGCFFDVAAHPMYRHHSQQQQRQQQQQQQQQPQSAVQHER